MGSSMNDPHSIANLLYLHPGCHLRRIEQYRQEAYENGWLVRRGLSPSEVPVLTHRGWVLPSSEGAWIASTPPPGRGGEDSISRSSPASG